MSADDLAVAFELAPPASSLATFLRNLWNTGTTCKTYELFPSLRVCSGLKKIYALLIERHQETSPLFDNTLFIVFTLVFFAFLISSIYTIFVEEKKSLKEIRNKVRKTTDALISILRAFSILKEVKLNNLRMEVECKKVRKMKIPTYLFDKNLIKKFEGAAIEAFADLNLPVKILQPEIFYTHEDEFPMESDWISLSSCPSEIMSLIDSEQLPFNNLRNVVNGPALRFPIVTEHSDVVTEKRNLRKRLETPSSGEIVSTKDFSSTALEAILEEHSHEEDISPTRKLKKNPLPPAKEYKLKKEKLGKLNSTSNEKLAKKNGIFSERRKIQDKVKRTKSVVQTKAKNVESVSSTLLSNKTLTNISKTTKETPKKSGIFNKSKPYDMKY